jgi:hypothetical protein
MVILGRSILAVSSLRIFSPHDNRPCSSLGRPRPDIFKSTMIAAVMNNPQTKR